MPGPCPTTERLSAVLRGREPDSAEAELAAHFSECAACQTQLEALAGGSVWLNAETAVADHSSASESLRQVMHELEGRTGAGGAQAFELDFLEPSEDPAMLGDAAEVAAEGAAALPRAQQVSSGAEAAARAPREPRVDGLSRTHVLVIDAAPVPIRLLVERMNGSVRLVEIVCGSGPRGVGSPPAWTLEARPERRLAVPVHPPPPDTAAPVARTGDVAFDRRFRMRDAGGHADRLLDEGQRARATALLDGWLAYWPGEALVYRVVPGHGAPLDNPIPISDLAFRGAIWDGAVDRLVTVLELLMQLAGRAWAPESRA